MYKIYYVVFRKYYDTYFDGDNSVNEWRISEIGDLGWKDRYVDAADEILNECKRYYNENGYLFDLTGRGEFEVSYKRNSYDTIVNYKIIKFEI